MNPKCRREDHRLSTHAHFEELCVLATSGQLSAEESEQLNRHLLECDNCRVFFKDAHFISARVIPQAVRAPRETRVPDGMRERFLTRAANEGLKIDAGSPVFSPLLVGERQSPTQVVTPSQRSLSQYSFFAALRQWQAPMIGAAACISCFALGLLVEPQIYTSLRGSSNAAVQRPPVQRPSEPERFNHIDTDRLHALDEERDQLAKKVASFTAQIAEMENEKKDAEGSLQRKLSLAQSDATRDHDALTRQSSALSAQVADLQTQLEIASQKESFAEADLKNARARNVEYSARLSLMQTQMRSQEMAPIANPDAIGSLVAARNLHIIDVYDSNAAGKRQPSFGRVFYVEGRSLVFYAYDLNSAHAQKNVTFHLWGERAGDKETTLSLGILRDDDPKERRWALTCDDPKLLAKINSVYVTAEMNNKQNDTPRGPRVLYAYFGAPPNHP
jgi:hypothetical protein